MIRALALGATLASPAHALSCMPPDVATSYTFAADSEDAYVVLWGELAFDPPALPPQPDDPNQPMPAQPVMGEFSGKSLIGDGSFRPFESPILIEPVCFGPWCAVYPESGTEMMIFALQEASGLRFVTDPCGTTMVPAPSSRDIERVQACHRGGACEPELEGR